MMAGGACLLLAMGVIGTRQRIVRLAPRVAALYAGIGLPVNVRGLEITALAPQRSNAADLTVSGAIRNIAQRRVVVPRLVYEVRDALGAPLAVWTEKAPAKTLGTGKTMTFVSAPHQVPSNGHSLLVRFEDDEPMPLIRLARRAD